MSYAFLHDFVDDSLAPALRHAVEEADEAFCDVGEELRGVGPEVELYTDDCHLTPEGNRIVGRILAARVLADMAAHAPR